MDTNMTDNNEIVNAIDAAFNKATAPVTPVTITGTGTYANPEEYRKATGRRFRMTKEEIAKYGESENGRMEAFNARQLEGKL